MYNIKSAITAFSLLATLFVSAFPIAANAGIQTVAEAINKSGRQRMLTQQIVRAYGQIGLNVKQSYSKNMLAQSVKLFDEQLKELDTFASTPELKKHIIQVRQLWPQFKTMAAGEVNKNRASQLLDASDDLLEACHNLVLEFQNVAGTKSARLINIAGRQRMLSQRISMFYMLKELGLDGKDKALDDGLNQALIEFKDALVTMNESEVNSAKISLALKSANKHFDKFQTMLGFSGLGPRNTVSDKADYLLIYFDRITTMYQEVSDKQ